MRNGIRYRIVYHPVRRCRKRSARGSARSVRDGDFDGRVSRLRSRNRVDTEAFFFRFLFSFFVGNRYSTAVLREHRIRTRSIIPGRVPFANAIT